MKNMLYGYNHEEECPCYELEAVLDDQLSECTCEKSKCGFDPVCIYDPETYDGYPICMDCIKNI